MALNAFANIFRIAELRARLFYTLVLLAVYRVGIFINTPGVDRAAMNSFMEAQKKAWYRRTAVPPKMDYRNSTFRCCIRSLRACWITSRKEH